LLLAGWSKDQFPVGQGFLCHPYCSQGLPSLRYNGYWAFPGVNWPEYGADQPSPSVARLQIVWSYNSVFVCVCIGMSWGDHYFCYIFDRFPVCYMCKSSHCCFTSSDRFPVCYTCISSHCCFNSSDRFPVCYTCISSHCCFNSSDRFPVCYTCVSSHCCFNSSDRFPVCYTCISSHCCFNSSGRFPLCYTCISSHCCINLIPNTRMSS